MPWKVVKVNNTEGIRYKLYNLDKKTYVNKTFKTRQAAVNTRRNYERYYTRLRK